MKIKTLMSIAATAALAASSVGITAHGEAGLYLIGDINGDGIVDSADACSALAAYACTSSGKDSPLFTYQESAADLNGDSQVDAVDASLILSYYAWASVSDDENPIMTDFLEKNGFKQKAEEEEKPAEQTDNGGSAPAANEAAPAAPAPVAEYVPQRIDSEYEEWFWVGDSRTVGMARSIAIDYIAKVGAGIKLFRDNAQSIYQIRNKTVIINLGVNDLDSGAYLRLYNSMPDEFLDNNTVIFMSVNPCDGNYSYLNSRIDAFNNAMRDGLDSRIQYLDSNTYLRYYGFGTTDGLHYTDATYADIYNFVFDSLIGEE